MFVLCSVALLPLFCVLPPSQTFLSRSDVKAHLLSVLLVLRIRVRIVEAISFFGVLVSLMIILFVFL